jgi:hypothetical protein
MEPSESSGGISFSEVTAEEFEAQTAREADQDRAADVQPEVPVAQQPAASMPAFDMDELISQIKEQVRAEILQEIASVVPAYQSQPQPEEEYSNEPDETYEMEPKAAYEPETGYAAEPESGTEYATGQEETYEEEAPAEEPSWEDDFEASFDIMAILDEQMESYSEMSIIDRMEEIDDQRDDLVNKQHPVCAKQNRTKNGFFLLKIPHRIHGPEQERTCHCQIVQKRIQEDRHHQPPLVQNAPENVRNEIDIQGNEKPAVNTSRRIVFIFAAILQNIVVDDQTDDQGKKPGT